VKKIVLNKCFGGFGLSDNAIQMYAELSGINLESRYYYDDSESLFWVYSGTEQIFLDWAIPRDDPNLIRVVEKMGDEANGDLSKLKIVEIDDDWSIDQIDDYDGFENETVL
jgi:hypothetical protein